MPTEVRRLIFSELEMQAILSAYAMSGSTSLPKGMVLNVKVAKDDPLSLTATIQTTDGRQAVEHLDEANVAASIINFCMSNRIPLSRRASKKVRKVPTGIALDMVQGDGGG